MGKQVTEIEQLYKALNGLTESMAQSPQVQKAVLDTNLVLGMEYKDPLGKFIIDASGDEIVGYAGECPAGVEPSVTLHLTADIANRYWQGKTNFMIAMQKGEIRPVGDLGAILKLVPVLGPLFKVYIDYLKSNGMTDMVL